MVETWRVIRDDDDGAKVVEVVSVLPSTQHGARPWVAWIDGGTAAGLTGLDAVARLARLCMWAVREILAPGEPTRAEAVAAEREDLARIGCLVGCDSLVGVEIHAAVEHELLERDAARDAAERAERERDDARAEVETLRAEHALAMERVRELEKELGRLRRGVVANAGRTSVGRKQRWAYVMDAVGCGSTRAAEMCVVAGFDPEGECGIEPDDEDERGGES